MGPVVASSSRRQALVASLEIRGDIAPQRRGPDRIEAGLEPDQLAEDMSPLLQMIVDRVPPPPADATLPFQMQICALDYSNYVGVIGVGRISRGSVRAGMQVAVIDADAMLFSTDFRGEERMAQLLTQVAGRAGRAELPGSVLLQTHYPDHPALLAMLTTSYGEQARAMLKRRQESGMPPAGQLVLLRTDCPNAEYGEQFLFRHVDAQRGSTLRIQAQFNF